MKSEKNKHIFSKDKRWQTDIKKNDEKIYA